LTDQRSLICTRRFSALDVG